MEIINWETQVASKREMMISEISELVRFKSVDDASSRSVDAPFGIENKRCLNWMLDKAQQDGFTIRNFDNYAGRIEYGPQTEIVGVVCHLDVVPADGLWESDPYECRLIDNILYGRGTNDNKGPTVAIYTALRILAESEWKPTRGLHLIFGCNEESGMKDMDYYVSHTDRLPERGFVPDCTFPVNYGEHGSCLIEVAIPLPNWLKAAESSLHPHITCGKATCTFVDFPDNLIDLFDFYLRTNGLSGTLEIIDSECTVTMVGKSAHGSRPYEGNNAAYHVLNFVFNLFQDQQNASFITCFQSNDGTGLAIRTKSFKTGDLSIAITGLTLSENRVKLLLDCRYPSDMIVSEIVERIQTGLAQLNSDVQCALIEDNPGFYTDPSAPLVTTLDHLYRHFFNDQQTPSKVSPGDTYARKFKGKLVAFGPTTRTHLKNKAIGQAHQVNEGMDIDILMIATEVYIESLRHLLGCVK